MSFAWGFVQAVWKSCFITGLLPMFFLLAGIGDWLANNRNRGGKP